MSLEWKKESSFYCPHLSLHKKRKEKEHAHGERAQLGELCHAFKISGWNYNAARSWRSREARPSKKDPRDRHVCMKSWKGKIKKPFCYFNTHFSSDALLLRGVYRILRLAFMWSTLRPFLVAGFFNFLRFGSVCISGGGGEKKMCLSITAQPHSVSATHRLLNALNSNEHTTCICVCVCVCVCVRRFMLYELICHFYKMTAGAARGACQHPGWRSLLRSRFLRCVSEPHFPFISPNRFNQPNTWHVYSL